LRKTLILVAFAAILGAAPISDWFIGNTLASGVWTSQASGGTIVQSNGGVTLSAPAGTTHDAPAGAVRISQTIANGDFALITKVSTIPPSAGSSSYYAAVLYAYQDGNNSVDIAYYGADGAYGCKLEKVVTGTHTTIVSSARSGDTFPIWLELTRATDTWIGKFSFNGTSWTTIGSGSQTFTIAGVSIYSDNWDITSANTLAYAPTFSFFRNAAADKCVPPVNVRPVLF
jgi:hypothetical protein